MRRFLLLLVGGFVLFMALAIADEWAFFSSAWFGDAAAEDPVLQIAKAEVEPVLRSYFATLSEQYSAPAPLQEAPPQFLGPEVTGELRADLMYLQHRGWRQSVTLTRMETDAVSALSPERVQVQTREWWSLSLTEGNVQKPVRESRVRALYRLQKKAGSWVVTGWDALPPGDFEHGVEDAGGSS